MGPYGRVQSYTVCSCAYTCTYVRMLMSKFAIAVAEVAKIGEPQTWRRRVRVWGRSWLLASPAA